MRATLHLAWRYLAYHRWRSAAALAGVALTLTLPFAAQGLVARYGASLTARAEATPLLLGAPGSRYDLVLDSLYFKGRTPTTLSLAAAERVTRGGLGISIPLYTPLTAGGEPLIGTDPEYFRFRGLVPAQGELPLRLGECVLGAEVASAKGLTVGGELPTDRRRTLDLAAGYPLRLRVVGVLAATGTPDDGAAFCDLKTAWIAAGIGHGHGEAVGQGERDVLRRGPDGEIVLAPSVVEFTSIDRENERDFHIHGSADELPLTAVVVVPRSSKARTQLKGRYNVEQGVQLLEPRGVIEELLGFVMRIKAFFDANTALVSVATVLFLSVIVALTLTARRRELEALFKIGCARGTVARLMSAELFLLVIGGALVAALVSLLLVTLAARGIGPL